uniref:PDZ domain-containing protein n=1 Tax=Anopheles melas TaxID=34690 RepID=A0A182TV95_9DIPT
MAEEVTAVLRMSKDGTTFGFLLRQIDVGEHVIYKIIENTPADMCAKVSGGCIHGRALGTVCLTAPSPQPPGPSMAAPYREKVTKEKKRLIHLQAAHSHCPSLMILFQSVFVGRNR